MSENTSDAGGSGAQASVEGAGNAMQVAAGGDVHIHTVQIIRSQQFKSRRDKERQKRDRTDEEKKKQKRWGVGDTDPPLAAESPPVDAGDAQSHLPVTDKEFADWFFALHEYDQCFVLAMTVFYGTSINRVRDAAEQLYQPLRELEKEQYKDVAPRPQRPRTPREQFLQRLHIVSSYSEGVDRLYWRDRDEKGDSEFGVALLLYIAKENALMFGGQEGQHFQARLFRWVENEHDSEVAYKAAGALGTFWYRQNKHRLDRLIDEWAASADEFSWHRAAWCLDGIYKIDRAISKDAADDIGKHVLSKLRDWAVRARRREDVITERLPGLISTIAMERGAEMGGGTGDAEGDTVIKLDRIVGNTVNLGCTAAITYAFLGRRDPEIGMNGLDSLLELPIEELNYGYQEIETLEQIYEAVIFCYKDLAINGARMREVLHHLAVYVRTACYERVQMGWGTRQEREQRTLQRTCRLEATFDILAMIADASFEYVEQKKSVAYQTTTVLPARPFLEREGRDMLLEGIVVAEEKAWRTSLSTLLCAACIEGHGKLATHLLQRWGRLVMRDQSQHPDDVRRAYVRFLRDLGIQVDTWCHQLQSMDVTVSAAAEFFKARLRTWHMPWRRQADFVPLGLLAQEVLEELPF